MKGLILNIIKKSQNKNGLKDSEIFAAVDELLSQSKNIKNVLLLPPDITRAFSYAGIITNYIYHLLKTFCIVDIMPALGTHQPMTHYELKEFFGDIPTDRFIAHDWINDVVKIGKIDGRIVSNFSEGIMTDSIGVSINKRIMSGYDLILSIGQVVPHEVVGMSNYNKNIFVGCGGSDIIDGSHILGSTYGMERLIGRDNSPVHKILDYAEKMFLNNIPIKYILTVTTQEKSKTIIHGLFCGRDRMIFEEAIAISQTKNIN